jgi:hypothetical protein
LLNAAALSKPQAMQNLAVDLSSYDIEDVSVVIATHCNLKHSDSAVAFDGYTRCSGQIDMEA